MYIVLSKFSRQMQIFAYRNAVFVQWNLTTASSTGKLAVHNTGKDAGI